MFELSASFLRPERAIYTSPRCSPEGTKPWVHVSNNKSRPERAA